MLNTTPIPSVVTQATTPDATNVVPVSAISICTLVPFGYGFVVWTKHPKRLNSLVWATTICEEPVSLTTDVALKGMRGTLRRSARRSATCMVVGVDCDIAPRLGSHQTSAMAVISSIAYVKRTVNS